METVLIKKHGFHPKRILVVLIVLLNFVKTTVCTIPMTSTQQPVNFITHEYEDYIENESVIFAISTDYCIDKASCSGYETFPGKSCHCDELCELTDDCCENYQHVSEISLKKEQFTCLQVDEIVKNKNFGVHMVTKCSEKWEHEATKELCEVFVYSKDIFLNLPVSHNLVTYRNMYCAQCNFIYEFEYWKQELKCLNETDVRSLQDMTDCDKFYIRPKPEIRERKCQLNPYVIETCTVNITENNKDELENCTQGAYGIVYDSRGHAYRNKYCAACNGVLSNLTCEEMTPSTSTPSPESRTAYSFKLLVDFNYGTVSINDEVISDTKTCKDNEKYDTFSEICREIFCAPPSFALEGQCVLNSTLKLNSTITANCTLVKLNNSEYIITNNSKLHQFFDNTTYSRDEFWLIGSDAYICLHSIQKCSNDCGEKETLYQFDMVESYLSLVGLIVSIISLSITLLVYITFSQLLNTPGKILVCLMTSLLLAQLMFLISAQFENISQLCMSVAVLTHYLFLAAFCWMNVVAFDLWMTFSNKFMSGGSKRNKRRFIKYNIYAWLSPFGIVSSAVAVDLIPFDDVYQSLKPSYGKVVCWISSRNGLILFFVGPLALFKLFDIVSFVFTAVHIARAKQQGAMATKRTNSCSFLINLKLSLIMGLTWVFAFIANVTNETSMWYLFIIFNSLQGLFIAACFLCTRKVARMLYDKYEQFSSKSTSGTQLSSI